MYPSRKRIISLKKVQYSLKHYNLNSNFKMGFFCVYSGPFIKGPFIKRVWYFLKNVLNIFFVLQYYNLPK